jgi:hypothetical protein
VGLLDFLEPLRRCFRMRAGLAVTVSVTVFVTVTSAPLLNAHSVGAVYLHVLKLDSEHRKFVIAL